MFQTKKIATALSILLLSFILAAYANAATVKRSCFIVSNLSCTSCLATIEEELKGMDGAVGMDADLRQGRVTVDHLDTLNHEQIAAAISNLGYPAAMEWTATLPEQDTKRFAGRNGNGSGCTGGDCGTSSTADAGQAIWKAPPADTAFIRTTLRVRNLSCTSCLSYIAAELGKRSSIYDMTGYLSRGVVIVDHADDLESSRIAAIITGLGYPAKAVATNTIQPQGTNKLSAANTKAGVQVVRAGSSCDTSGPCNATSAAWQKLYNRYFTRTNSR